MTSTIQFALGAPGRPRRRRRLAAPSPSCRRRRRRRRVRFLLFPWPGWRWGTTPSLRYSALYRVLYGTPVYTSANHHALFMTGSPKIRQQHGTARASEGKGEERRRRREKE